MFFPSGNTANAAADRPGQSLADREDRDSIEDLLEEPGHHESGRLVGIFTERDVLRRIVGEGRDPRTTAIRDVMTANLITIGPDATVEQTMAIFTEKRCRHLPVLENGALVGSISIGDITRWMGDVHRAEAEHLKNYITTGFSA